MNNIKIDRAFITVVMRFLASWIFKKSVIENIQNSRTKNNLLKTKGTYKKITIEYFGMTDESALSEYF